MSVDVMLEELNAVLDRMVGEKLSLPPRATGDAEAMSFLGHTTPEFVRVLQSRDDLTPREEVMLDRIISLLDCVNELQESLDGADA